MTQSQQEVLDARAALRNAQAKAARVEDEEDLEDLRFLNNLTARRARARRFIEDDEIYNALKRRFMERLKTEVALHFTDYTGKERFATPYRSFRLVIDEELLLKTMQELGYDEALIDSVLPRKFNAEALRRLLSKDENEKLRDRVSQFSQEVPHVSYVSFSDPVWDDDEEVEDVT